MWNYLLLKLPVSAMALVFVSAFISLGCKASESPVEANSDPKMLGDYFPQKRIFCSEISGSNYAQYLVEARHNLKEPVLTIVGPQRQDVLLSGNKQDLIWCGLKKNQDVCGLTLCDNCSIGAGGKVYTSKYYPGDAGKADQTANQSWTRVAMRRVGEKTNIFIEHWYTVYPAVAEKRQRLYSNITCREVESVAASAPGFKKVSNRFNQALEGALKRLGWGSSAKKENEITEKKAPKSKDEFTADATFAKLNRVGKRFVSMFPEPPPQPARPGLPEFIKRDSLNRIFLNDDPDSPKLTINFLSRTDKSVYLTVIGTGRGGNMLLYPERVYKLNKGSNSLTVELDPDALESGGYYRRIAQVVFQVAPARESADRQGSMDQVEYSNYSAFTFDHCPEVDKKSLTGKEWKTCFINTEFSSANSN